MIPDGRRDTTNPLIPFGIVNGISLLPNPLNLLDKKFLVSDGLLGEPLKDHLINKAMQFVVGQPGHPAGGERAGQRRKTRAEARQLVSHKAILVNGQICNIPSAIVAPNAVISVCDKSKAQARIIDAVALAERIGFPGWVDVNTKEMKGTFKHAPDRSEFASDINESLVVELYSK